MTCYVFILPEETFGELFISIVLQLEMGREWEGGINFFTVAFLQQCSLLTTDISFPQLLFNVRIPVL